MLLGSLYSEILGDNEKSEIYTEKSCDLDYESGCEMLGLQYSHGTDGFEVDKKKAKYFYKKACKLGAK